MKEQQDINELFQKYINQTISAAELKLLQALVQDTAHEQQLESLLEQYFVGDLQQDQPLAEASRAIRSQAWEGIQLHINKVAATKPLFNRWYIKTAAAAAIVLATVGSFYFFNHREDVILNHTIVADIQPGGNKATLKSSSGGVYNLSGSKGEIIVDSNNIHYEDGVILKNEAENEIITLSTPRGGQYKVTLSDGTKVWLNAASSIVYPTNFTADERKVELTGEAYFEVAHNANQPFIVATKNQKIKVLGTTFNVNAYNDDSKTVTTLLTGSVQLSKNNNSILGKLTPGQQAVLNGGNVNIENVDATIFSAWKDGEFRFKASSLVDVLRQIERWYDVDIDYANVPSDIFIHASINRNRQLSTVLIALEKITDLKFQVKGRSIKLMH
jgi:hypothetical protein